MFSINEKFRSHLKSKKPVDLGHTVLQTWWVIEKCVESPESDRVFCKVVGTLRKQSKDLKKPYRQTEVLVLTRTIGSRVGIPFNWRPQISLGMHAIRLSPIDYAYEVFPGWD